ncbi:AzlD domain-containing protein [Vibrio mediterranei]|jgi:branched-subunit amino acid transport protein|uniref:AzlD domain-containing protein n=1 Tax=Vibrio barjaei TaxID=1676683 RepID=UPI0007BB42D1|nr:AzlD domain-containing protein [Vibrio barjaei]MCG9788827.1 AzlD domain-containing protein [Vibrio mediterranei]OIN23958.1 branched-chain amino acid ABC transporter [Vibrio barjaei]
MTYLIILVLTAIVFLSRYLFLEPTVPLRLSSSAQRFLSYASPAVLTAIWGPIVFLPHGELSLADNLPYLIAATFAAAMAWLTKNVLLTTIVSILVFLVLNLWIFNR